MGTIILVAFSCLVVSTAAVSGDVEVQAEFISRNAVRVSTCASRKLKEVIKSVDFILKNEIGELTYVTNKLKDHEVDKTCKTNVLWFDEEEKPETNLTIEVFTLVINASNHHERREGVYNLYRAARNPPVILKVEVFKNGEYLQTVAGPSDEYIPPEPVPIFIPKPKSGYVGDSVKLVCHAVGFPLPKVKWYKSGTLVGSEATYNTTADGVYTCVASNKHGVQSSHVIHLKKMFATEFGNPNNLLEFQVYAGSSVTLRCDYQPDCFPKCHIMWFHDTFESMLENTRHVNSSQYSDVFITDEDTLVMTDIKKKDQGYYQCEANAQLLGQKYKLNVIEGKSDISVKAAFHSEKNKHAVAGDKVNLYCLFPNRFNFENVMVKWTKNDKLLDTNKTILTFNSISEEDAGEYKCQGSTKYRQLDQYKMNVRVESKPTIDNSIRSGLKHIEAVKGSDVHIRFNITGKPTPQVTIWWNSTSDSSHYVLKENTLTIKNISEEDIGIVSCKAWNLHGYSYASVYVNVSEPTKIFSKYNNKYIHFEENEVNNSYICDAVTDKNTDLKIVWLQNNNIITTNRSLGLIVKHMHLEVHVKENNHEAIFGEYKCKASNNRTAAEMKFGLFPYLNNAARTANSMASQSPITTNMVLLSIGVVVTIAVMSILILIILIITIRKRSKRNLLKHIPARSRCSTLSQGPTRSRCSTVSGGTGITSMNSETEQFLVIQNQLSIEKDYPIDVRLSIEKDYPNDVLHVRDPTLRSTVCEVYIDRDNIVMNELIGKGQFGRVYAAVLTGKDSIETKVAVKTLKYKADETEIVDCFLREAVIMKNFTHPHVLTLTGISFELDGSPMVVLPYMSNGDLRNYIQDPNKDITVLELLKLGLQVARGMMYLSLRKYVHRDLACRNCMVDETNTVKVADFGLSRNLFSRDYYREASGKRPLPVRWMAPECHHSNVFTTQSDVWSFGILLWELMTRGAVPYQNIENWNVSSQVVAGSKLPQPNYCPTSVYKIMLSCWEIQAENRTPFSLLVHNIEDIVHMANMGVEESESFYINVDTNEEKQCKTSYNNNNDVILTSSF